MFFDQLSEYLLSRRTLTVRYLIKKVYT